MIMIWHSHTPKRTGVEPVEYNSGDVNGDNAVNITDISMISAHVKGKKQLDEKGFKAADVNGDGKVNVSDIVAIAAHVKGIKLIK